jgi:ABC-type polysaccharide/polyol phosphate export permease
MGLSEDENTFAAFHSHLDIGFVTSLPGHYAAARQSFASEIVAAGRDIRRSVEQWQLWNALAVNDVLSRYRGSVLGPFWITLSTAAFVLGIASVYGGLMHVANDKFVPWISTGVVVWTFIQVTIQDAGDSYISAAVIIRSGSIPLPVFVWRVVWRNMMVLGHQSIVIIVVALWYHYLLKINLPVAILGFAFLLFNLTWISFFVAIAAARYRDLQQVNAAVLQLVFFISPIIWIPSDMHGVRNVLLYANPVTHLVGVIRNPLLGVPVPLESFVYLLVMGVIGWLVTYILYASVRRRIVHYL